MRKSLQFMHKLLAILLQRYKIFSRFASIYQVFFVCFRFSLYFCGMLLILGHDRY